MNPIPPTTLNKETIGVWHGWGNIGDKEVAREAAAKGLHINLAITFLCHRKKIKFADAQVWFREEVIKWVQELLEKKQIFKASHILNNIGVDPGIQFGKIFYTTSNTTLRDYIGKHLLKVERLDENMQYLWSFLNLILENAPSAKSQLPTESLECLDHQSEAFKSEVATILFLKTEDNRLCKFLNSETLWKHLLINNDINSLLAWINVRYRTTVEDSFEGNIIEQFKKFSISAEMLTLLSSDKYSISLNIKNAIYNELSKFGIFENEEKNNFITILKRLKNSFSIANVYQILMKSECQLTIVNFIKLLTEYCLDREYLHILNICIKDFKIPLTKATKDLNLIKDFRLLVKEFNEKSLRSNILNVSNILSGNGSQYYNENPIILASLLFFTKEINVMDVLLTELVQDVNDIKLDNLLKEFHILNTVCLNKMKGSPECNLNIYLLIDDHLGLDSKCLIPFRFTADEFSNFYTNEIVQNHGYSKKLDHNFYIQELKPSTAAKVLILSELQCHNLVNENQRERVEKKVCKLALTDFDCDEICSSCTSFIEMIGLDSLKLRVLIRTARTLHKFNYEKESLLELLFNNEDNPYSVQNLLEKQLLEIMDSNPFLTGLDLLQLLKVYETVIQYSKINNIKLPELFLKYCASRNLWLPFLILAQIYDFPLEQIKLLIQFFKSPNMLEHLTHSVVNEIQIEEKNVLIRERDSRKYLLSKIGVRGSIDVMNQYSSSSIKSQSSLESEQSSTGSDFFEIDISNIKATLLQTLIRCHNSTDPPKALLQASQLYRNPLLAIAATSYEPDSIITNWLTWLSVSCELCKVFTNYETMAVSANSVANLLENCLRNQYPRTVLESFEIFIPENPLKIFMEFLNFCHEFNFDNTLLVQKLELFQSLLKNSRKNSIISEVDHEMTYLHNKIWIEMTAMRLLSSLLDCNYNSLYDQILVTQNLCKIKIWKYFSCDCPNFHNIFDILTTLYYSNSCVKLDISVIFDLKHSRQAVISCINALLEKQEYQAALKIAQIENLPPDLILVKEWQHKMNYRDDQQFWNICNETFTKHNVTADCVVDFYVDCSDKFSEVLEKFTLLKLAWEWATKYDLTCQHELEKNMWMAFLYLDEKHKDLGIFDIKPSNYLYKDLVQKLNNVSQCKDELNKDFMVQLDHIVTFVLNKRDFYLALRLQKMFNLKNTDIETLKLCTSLAEGVLLPYQLNAEQRLLLSNVNYLRTYSHRRTFVTRFSSLSSSSHSPANSLQIQMSDNVDSYINDTLAILKLLSEHLHNGVDIGRNIFMNYRISINIEIPYEVVVTATDYMKILKDALEDNCMNKLDVVHDFVLVYKWSNHEVADFICEELINATSSYVEINNDHLIMWDLNIDQDFQLVLQLLKDNCSILGYKIYSYASTVHKSQIESEQVLKASDLALVIELLIRAHDCFTADCNMEGISIILKKAREVVANLLILHNWKLMVRLLTGVARYTEMNFVFQILKENDQFEFLLRKGLRKDNALKVALLDYLKKFCPDNRDLYKIVALHFTLFSEVAMLWEREAQNVIKNLISISKLEMQNDKLNPEEEPFILFQNTDSTKICLNKAMENYIHATDFHLQGEKLSKALSSAKQAELIAMQLAILNEVSANTSVVCLLNLKSGQIDTLISSKLNFEQSLILVDAYNFHADWASILYEQYIAKNNVIFLEGFLRHRPLTDTLAHDISRKFIVSGINSVGEIKCMKNILNRLSSIHMKYRIASELGFTDLIEDLIVSGQLVYLKDTVWKKGYKN